MDSPGRQTNAGDWLTLLILSLVVLPALLLFFWGYHGFRQQTAAERARAAALMAQEKSVVPRPRADLPAATPPPPAFAAAVADSHQWAVIKYPELGVADSRFNRRFLRHLQLWRDLRDPRLNQPNWAEKLADVCQRSADDETVAGWLTPKPPYPYSARTSHAEGSGAVRVATDERGDVITATMALSTGSDVLDRNTISFAKANWKGPPNTTNTIPITYRLQ